MTHSIQWQQKCTACGEFRNADHIAPGRPARCFHCLANIDGTSHQPPMSRLEVFAFGAVSGGLLVAFILSAAMAGIIPT